MTSRPKQHVDIQAAAQKWVDSSISKTANVPTDYPLRGLQGYLPVRLQTGPEGLHDLPFQSGGLSGCAGKGKDLENTVYEFTLEDGSKVSLKGNEEVEYDGETHSAANLYDALKEGYYGKF